jgi:hypothetical protein
MRTILAKQAHAAKTDSTPDKVIPRCDQEFGAVGETATQLDHKSDPDNLQAVEGSGADEATNLQAPPFMLKFLGLGNESRETEFAEAIRRIPAPTDPASETDLPDSNRMSNKTKSAGASG